MAILQSISLKLSTDLIDRIKSKLDSESMSEFIRKTIEDALNNQDDVTQTELIQQQKIEHDISQIAKNIDKLNTKNLEIKFSDLESKIQIIYEKLVIDDRVLKNIYRRSAVAAHFNRYILDHLKESSDFRKSVQVELLEDIKMEYNKLILERAGDE